jgi:hypothetical protein
MRTYLVDSLRIEPEGLGKLKAETILLIADQYRSRRLRLLGGMLRKMGMKRHEHE